MMTKNQIDAATHDGNGAATYFTDGSVPGLRLRVWASGKKTFAIRYYFGGKRRTLTIGTYGKNAMSLKEVRTKARDVYASVQMGIDPQAESERRPELTLRALCDRFLAEYAVKHRAASYKDDVTRVRHAVGEIGNKLAVDVTRDDVRSMHAELSKRQSIGANRVVQMLRKIYNFGVDVEALPEDHRNPAEKIKLNPEKPRQRWLSSDELARLIPAIEADDDPYVRSFFKLSLLTGARKNDLLTLKWSDVDLVNRQIVLPHTKNGQPHAVPLTTRGVAAIETLHRFPGNPYVFPGAKKGAHRTTVDKRWASIRQRAELKDVTIHDLRRTAGSIMANAGVSGKVAGDALNHKDASTTERIYMMVAPHVRREAFQHVENALAVAEGANVVSLDDVRTAKA